jgi:hypothetical protein
MTKKTQTTTKVISTSLHKDFSTFSKNMVNDYFVAIEEIRVNKHENGKQVKSKAKKIVNATGKPSYCTKSIPILVKDGADDKIVTTDNSDVVHLSNQRACLSDEALLYLVHLSGHNKNMLLFIVFYLINTETLEFRTDSYIKKKYEDFCIATGCKLPSKVTIEDSIKKLREIGLILNVSKNLYLINPILLGYGSDMIRLKAIRIYSQKLFDKGKDIADWLLPNIGLLKK